MRRFVWPLARVLEVALKREQAMREEVAALAAQAALVRREIMDRRARIMARLDELGRRSLGERLADQAVLMAQADVERRKVAALEQALEDLRERRRKKMAELLEQRKSRRALERLRDKAQERHLLHEAREEQRQLDEVARMRYVRQKSLMAAAVESRES